MGKPGRRYTVILDRQPKKALGRLPKDLLQRIDRAILALADAPRPPGCKKLAGHDNLYRVRVGDWRISYAVEDDRLIVLVIEVAPRGEAYRDL
jgi:mRNA interferase RelE/StbE